MNQGKACWPGSALVLLGTVLALGAWSVPGLAQEPAPPPAEEKGRPRIVVEPKALYVGEVFAGEKGKGQIKIQNTGTATLKILKVRSGCGCTATKLKDEDKEIPAGGFVMLPVTMTPSKVPTGDRFVKSITIVSNDPVQPALPVRIEARVKVGVEVSPPSLIFKKMQYGEVRVQGLKLQGLTEEPFQITGIDKGSGPVMLEYDQELVALAHMIKVTVGPMPDLQNVHLRLRIRTTHSKSPVLNTPLLVEVEKLIAISPTYLNLGRHDPGSVVEGKITLSTKEDRPIKSVKARVTRYPMEVTARPVEGSPDQWVLAFQVPEEMPRRKLISPVVITTDLEQAGPIKMTVSLIVSPPATETPGQE